jgi:hypothetical protein
LAIVVVVVVAVAALVIDDARSIASKKKKKGVIRGCLWTSEKRSGGDDGDDGDVRLLDQGAEDRVAEGAETDARFSPFHGVAQRGPLAAFCAGAFPSSSDSRALPVIIHSQHTPAIESLTLWSITTNTNSA